MMLFQGSRALMMIIIIINGTARELTNNGEQMIPSWPQKEKKRSVRLQKIKQILSWQFQIQMPQLESVSGFTFSLWRAKSTKDLPLLALAMPYEAKEGIWPPAWVSSLAAVLTFKLSHQQF